MVEKWIQKADVKKGALHRELGIPENEEIPLTILNKIANAEIDSTVKVKGKDIKVTTTLKRRVNFALNVRK